jgi:predicted metal-dependent phosphoesterase TrpH
MHTIQQQDLDSFRADLHSHTIFSDGSFTPKELIDHAVHVGLSALSITDHDTIEAYVEAVPYAKEKGVLLGTGVEFSSVYKKTNVHILGYDIDLAHPFLIEFCAKQQKRRNDRNNKILEKLRRFRFNIEESDLHNLEPRHRAVGRPHIAKLLLEKGYVKSIQEAFSIYIGDGKCCYEQGDNPGIAEVIDVIKQARGKVFLAHPHLMVDGNLVKEVLKHPFDGIECYYARCNPEKERRWLKIAKEKSYLISGGSDFHGAIKPHISLGCSWVGKDEFLKIFPHYG